MRKILIVDDDDRLRSLIRTYAEADGYSCAEACDGESALALLDGDEFDLVVLDVMMPGRDGFEVLGEVRKTSGVPVIMLTARSEEYDRLHGFSLGADDYVPKPFSPKELLARVTAVLRRAAPESSDMLKCGGLEIFEQYRSVRIDGADASMTPKEFDLLLYMAKHNHVALDRERLLKNVWGFDYYGDSRTVDTHVKSLREHLGPYRGLIATVWGVGYRFEYNGDAENVGRRRG